MRLQRNRIILVLVAAAFFACMICMLCGCRYTDFFTETVYTWDADKRAETGDVQIVNSPDAETEDKTLTALDWSDDALKTSAVETLVTYSDDPNTDLSARHSVFNIDNRFKGIEASDPVKLIYGESDALDHEVEMDEEDEVTKDVTSKTPDDPEENKKDSKSSSKKSKESKKSEKASSPSGEQTKDGGEGDEGKSEEDAKGDSNENSGDSDAGDEGESDEGEGKQDDPSGGYDGQSVKYDPNTKRAKLNKADHVVACGQAAVMVQALAGKDGLVGMDAFTYNGSGTCDDVHTAYASTFEDVFSDELPEDGMQLLWQNDGTSVDDLIDPSGEALVKACGKGGVIFFDDYEASYEQRFGDIEKVLWENDIQCVPINLGTVQGMMDAATAIGDVLKGSDECAQDAKAMADDYCDTIDSIVKAVADTHGGKLANGEEWGDHNNPGGVFTAYTNCPVTEFETDAHPWGTIAVDFEKGVHYLKNGEDITDKFDMTGGVLFSYCYEYYNEKRDNCCNAFWMQTAGIMDSGGLGTDNYKQPDNYSILYGENAYAEYMDENLSSVKGAFKNLGGNQLKYRRFGWSPLASRGSEYQTREVWMLGSSAFPYLIVAGTSKYDTGSIKTATVKSMESANTPLSYSTTWVGLRGRLDDLNEGLTQHNAFTDDGVSAEESVRENPNGLLGMWTSFDGSMESVLEPIWLAQVYSKAPAHSKYEPKTDMSGFSTKIGDTSCDSFRAAVEAFYETFYRYDVSGAYSDVVPDEGL